MRSLLAGVSSRTPGSRTENVEPSTELGGDHELAAVAVEDVLDDREAEAGAALLPACRHVDAVEALGEPRQVLRGDAGPVVDHVDPEAAGPAERRRLPPHADLDLAAATAVLDGVLHQVLEHLGQLVVVAAHDGGVLAGTTATG